MKIPTQIAIVASLSLVAGCAQSHKARYSENISSSPTYAYDSTAIASEPGGGLASSSSVYTSQGAMGGTSSSDAEIVAQVRETLRQDPTLAEIVPGLQISAANGVVTLSGNIANPQQKQTINSVVQEIAGVTTVNNELQVSGQTASTETGSSTENGNLSATSRTDQNNSSLYSGNSSSSTNSLQNNSTDELNPTSRTNSESQIYSNSTNDMNSAGQQLNPTSRTNSESQIYSQSDSTSSNTSSNQNNSLSPTSNSQNQRNYQSDANNAENGVTVMVQGSSATDQTLAQRITQDLRSNSSLSSALSQVRISLENGTVTLQGSVPNEQKKKDIESAVQEITGVTSVNDQLQVGSSQPSPMNQ